MPSPHHQGDFAFALFGAFGLLVTIAVLAFVVYILILLVKVLRQVSANQALQRTLLERQLGAYQTSPLAPPAGTTPLHGSDHTLGSAPPTTP